MRIFISHSSKDAELAEKVCGKIENSGHSCFLAPRDIRSGYEYAEEIINGIDDSDVVLLLLSQAANDSPHVLREIERAVSKKKSVIVCKLEEVVLSKSMEYFLMTHQWLSTNGSDDFSEIIVRINEYAAAHGSAEASASEEKAPVPVGKSSGSRRRNIILASAAVVLLCAGVAAGAGIARRAPAAGEIPTAAHAPAEQPEPAADKQNTPPQEPAQPEITTPSVVEQNDNIAAPPQQSSPADTEAAPENAAPASPETAAPAPITEAVPTTDSQPQQPQEAPAPEKDAAEAELGDWLMFGTYNGEPIKWRVLRLSEDGTRALVISEDIITMKAYDAAEGGEYNKYGGEDYWSVKLSDIPGEVQRQIRGDNRWEYSNIRTWLNSDRENVTYADQAPTPQAMSEKRSGYHTEAGFLKSFTKQELSAVTETEITTGGSVTTDRVFLLSSDELEWLYEADVSIFAKPTEAAVELDKSQWYMVDFDAYGVEDFFWWLRDPNPENSCECYYINLSCSDRRIVSGSVGLEGFGIRPAMTLDLTSEPVIKALENAHDTD